MKYYYFLSFFKRQGLETGWGCTDIVTSHQINDFSIIDEVMSMLKEQYGFDEVVIMNYQLLRAEEGEWDVEDSIKICIQL